MLKSSMIADCLRSYAHWRLDRAEEADDGRNARSAIALISAAAYAQDLDDSAPVMTRLTDAGCFADDRFDPGAEAVRIIRGWHCDDAVGEPAALLDAVAAAAERKAGRPKAGQATAGQTTATQSKAGRSKLNQAKGNQANRAKRSRSRRRAFRSG